MASRRRFHVLACELIDTQLLAGRTALVTGASRGLGRAIAVALAARGAAVALAARTETVWQEDLPGTVHETAAEITAAGGTALAVPTDLEREEEVEQLVQTVRTRLGPIGVLVNNAALTVGGGPPRTDRPAAASGGARSPKVVRLSGPPSIVDVPLRAYRRHIAVNVLAPYLLMQAVLPEMAAAGRGAIVNVSSRSAFAPGEGPYPEPGRPALFAYGSTKAALHNLSQAVAVEGASRGVAVNVVIPAKPIPTPGSVRLFGDQDVGEWATPEDFAQAVVELAAVAPETCTGRILWHDEVHEAVHGVPRA